MIVTVPRLLQGLMARTGDLALDLRNHEAKAERALSVRARVIRHLRSGHGPSEI